MPLVRDRTTWEWGGGIKVSKQEEEPLKNPSPEPPWRIFSWDPKP